MLSAALALSSAGAASAQTTPAPSPVTVVVAVPSPVGLPRAKIEAGIRASVPAYRAVPGLLRKYFTVGQTDFGGVYLFSSRSTADAWFNDAWRTRIVETYGKPAVVTYYDVPVAIDNDALPASIQVQP
jgi:hypothetical protein